MAPLAQRHSVTHPVVGVIPIEMMDLNVLDCATGITLKAQGAAPEQ
jgi:hypothetical protein